MSTESTELPINPLTQLPVTDDQLKNISHLATQLLSIEHKIDQHNQSLEVLNDERRRLSETLIPDAMNQVGMSSFKLSDGTAILIEKFYSASIPKDKHFQALAWLRSNHFESLIKRNVSAKFGKGEDDLATQLVKFLVENKFDFEDKQSIHPQTLKAFVKERMEAGDTLPTDLLGVFVGNKTKLTPAEPTKQLK